MNVGSKISEARKLKGLSQEGLADLSHISLSTIQRIEKNSVSPRPHTLKTLADLLELDMEDLSDLKSESPSESKSNTSNGYAVIFFLLSLFPFLNVCLIYIIFKLKKTHTVHDNWVRHMLSFQLIWSISTFIIYILSIMMSNIITKNAGSGLYVSMIVYLVAVIFNVVVILKNSHQINSDSSVFKNIPSFF